MEVSSAVPKQDSQPCSSIRLMNADADCFVEMVSQLLRPFSLNTAGEQPFKANIESFQLLEINLHRFSFNQDITVKTEPVDSGFILDIPLIGQYKNLRQQGYSDLFLPDRTARIDYGTEPIAFALSNHEKETRLGTITIAPPILQDHVFKLTGSQETNLEIQHTLNWHDPISASFQRYLSFIWSELERDSACWRSPLLVKQMHDTFLTMFWEASQENLGSERQLERETCKPSYITLATAYIDAYFAEPISIADIASAVGIHARTLYKGFRTYLKTTPMAYLKGRRLGAVRRSLQLADPHVSSVTDIALKWGFNHLGHFAADYRQAFGELPSETLRS